LKVTKHKILIVDSDIATKEMISSLFQWKGNSLYHSMTADDGLDFLKKNEVSLLIVSSDLEGMNLMTFLNRAVMVSPRTVRIIVTDLERLSSLTEAISKGTIFHFLTKPLKEEMVARAVRGGLSCFEDASSSGGRNIFDQVQHLKRLKKEAGKNDDFKVGLKDVATRLGKGWSTTVKNLVRMVESKVPYLSGHADEVSLIARTISAKMGLADDLQSDIELASFIHDLGMVLVNEDALKRAGPIEESEMAAVREHPYIAETLLDMGLNQERVKLFVKEHHERFDGKGYPEGLTGDEISLGGRILAVSEFVASARHNRSYRNAMTDSMIMDHLREMSGTAFDPEVVKIFITLLENEEWPSKSFVEEEKEEQILIVDDEVNILKSLKRLLRKKGYSVIICEKPEEALDIVRKGGISIIISDHRMPGMTGVELLQKARQIVPDVPRILLTGYADKSSAIDAINKGGVYRYLEKPWFDDELVAVIKSALVQSSARRRLDQIASPLGGQESLAGERAGVLKADLLTTLEAMAEKDDKIKELSQAKDEFLGIASHELRTPLQLITNGVELLKEETDHELRGRFLSIIDAGTQRITRVVGEIFEAARKEGEFNVPRVGQFDVKEMLEEMSDNLSPFAKKRKQNISLSIPDDPPPFRGDREMIRDAVMNLVNNAIRFTPDGGKIEISTGNQGGEQVIAVSDSGIGVPPDEQAKIFDKFYVVGEGKRNGAWEMDFMAGSIGLGLSIVRSVAEKHGGRVEVESPVLGMETGERSEGSRFSMIIPAHDLTETIMGVAG
jgi:response regulator RpfG family c-di-GMP phosphodiesterase